MIRRSAPLRAFRGFRTGTQYWQSAIGYQVSAGTASMTIVTAFRLWRTVTGINPICGYYDGTNGYKLTISAAGLLQFAAVNGAGALITSTGTCVLGTMSVNTVLTVAVWMGADNTYVACNGILYDTTACVGYTPVNSVNGDRFRVGIDQPGTAAAQELELLAVGVTDNAAIGTVAATTYSAAFADDLNQNREINWWRAPVAGHDWIWDARDMATFPIAQTTWRDEIASIELYSPGPLQVAGIPSMNYRT